MGYSLILDPDLSLGGTPEIEILDEATHKLELVDPTPDGGVNLNKPIAKRPGAQARPHAHESSPSR